MSRPVSRPVRRLASPLVAGLVLALAAPPAVAAGGSASGARVATAPTASPAAGAPAAAPSLERRLASAFRSEVSSISLDLDYHPGRGRVRGTATLDLTLRPGQTRALFHFNPLRDVGTHGERAMLRSVRFDGERLDPGSRRDLRVVRAAPGAEPAFEVRRAVRPGSAHRLVVSWRAPVDARPGWMFPVFDDTEGPDDETETMWPTVSSPEVLARHRARVQVHGPRPYTVMGGGDVVRGPGPGQTWTFDTGRAVSSSNVFLAAVPRDDVRRATVRVGGVEVRIVTDRDRSVVRRARAVIRETVPVLQRQLGRMPVREIDVLLTAWGSGMEYYRATRTGIGALEHELGHMYFGTTTVNRTWRDTWFDEAAVVWSQAFDRLQPVARNFRYDLARDRPVAAPGFDTSAYGAGARILENVARAVGGDRAMLRFLGDLQERRRYRPFTTDDLIDDVVAAQDRLRRPRLERWLYGRS